MKVGGIVLSEVRMLGGMALAATLGVANANTASSLSADAGGGNGVESGGRPGGGAFRTIRSLSFSRSAPCKSSFGDIGKKVASSRGRKRADGDGDG
jgi:hypothetical protein